MKSGEVVHIRLNPEDVMGCIDVCKTARVYIDGMSLAQVARLALSGLLEAARKHEVIPRREGFEYAAMVQPILAVGRNGKKLQITSIIEQAEASRVVADLPATPVNVSLAKIAPSDALIDVKKSRVLRKVVELEEKLRVDPDNFDMNEDMQLMQLREVYNALVDGKDQDIAGML